MKRIHALSFALAAMTGAVAGLPITIHADDTEIYVGNRAFSANVRPILLLILDTSGSMAATDGQALDRLDRVKIALNAILDDVNDMNIGLARFHTPGGAWPGVVFASPSLQEAAIRMRTSKGRARRITGR